jgi:hypothetical protein
LGARGASVVRGQDRARPARHGEGEAGTVDFSSGGNASPQHYAKTGEIIRAAGMKLEQ